MCTPGFFAPLTTETVMTDMREYAAQHGWEVGSHLRYAGSTQPPSVITYISATEIRISTPGDFPGRLTGGSSSALGKWTLDWQYRAEQAEAAIARVQALCSQSRAVVSRGCSCHADECSGTCGAGRPLAWDLDPADVLRALDGDNDE